uniref:Uncharacterized protein n=1 Tax=Oscillatoriales cyanobacterium SpSt-402 TaxID=2282168 RepID=A0A832H5E7_9CYAN
MAFRRLHATLVNYFTGSATPLESIPVELREPFFLWREYYLSLYGLLHEAWGAISDAARGESLPLPETPGKLLIELLHVESDAIFAIAFPKLATGNDYFEFSPRAEYKFYNEGLKVSKLLHSRDLAQPEKQRIERYKKQAKGKLKGWLRFKVRLLFCLHIAEKTAKRNSFVKRKLREFNKADANWQADLIAAIHPSKSARGFAFRSGQKLLSSSGGVYKT